MSEAVAIQAGKEDREVQRREGTKSVNKKMSKIAKLVAKGMHATLASKKVGLKYSTYVNRQRKSNAAAKVEVKRVAKPAAKRKYTRRAQANLPVPMKVFTDLRQQAERSATLTPVAVPNSQPVIVILGDVTSLAAIITQFRSGN